MKIYSKVYSHKTGWVLGVIEDHVARPLHDYELEDAVERLNKSCSSSPCPHSEEAKRLDEDVQNARGMLEAALVLLRRRAGEG